MNKCTLVNNVEVIFSRTIKNLFTETDYFQRKIDKKISAYKELVCAGLDNQYRKYYYRV